MNIQIKELNDNRSIGFGVFEIASFPMIDGSSKEIEAELELSYNMFLHITREFYKLGGDANTVTELLWITEKADKQTFRSRVRIFCIIRKISEQNPALQTEIERLLNHFSLAFYSKQYRIEIKNELYSEFLKLIGNVNKDCIFSVVKSEKCAGNATSIYPYYYTDIVPSNNVDNFVSIIATMSQYENCAISFQLFPTQLTQQEKVYLNEVTGELGRLTTGMFTQQGMYRDKAAEEPYAVLSAYQERTNSPLFLYNILVFGERDDCVNLAGKIVSLLQSGKKRVMNPDFTCLDLSGEKIDLPTQYMQYPWNINNKLVYTYRNKQLFDRIPMAKMLYRLPYIMTVDETAAFFRLPFREKTMAALRSNQTSGSVEQFDASVVSEKNITFGTLISHDSSNITIGCPENAFTKHALVVGTPGSGKTTFSFNILLQFIKRGIPFLAIEPTKAEYRAMIDAIPDVQIFTPGNNNVSPFIINPFIPPKGITIEQYIPSLASAFKAAFHMPSPLDIIFLRAIRACYSENGWKDYSKYGDNDVLPFGLYEFILTFKRIISESDYSGEVKGNLQSAGVFRLMNLIEQNSNIFDTIHTVPIEDMLRKPTILELNSIDNTEQKALIMALLLISIGVYTKNNQLGDGKLKNIILIDKHMSFWIAVHRHLQMELIHKVQQ
ncbi:MAG: type IV secretory system conjugative DNA transfer family protein [Treponema sp.]|nr:type IV secretory system conjugative DNA transfer family protein [Treponema sp.]